MTASTSPGEGHVPRRPPLVAEVVHNGDGEAECTLSPADVPEERESTAWLTACGEGFVDLEDVR